MERTYTTEGFYPGDNTSPELFKVSDTEGRELLSVRGWSTKDLVSFGNFVLNRFRNSQREADFIEDVQAQVWDADLENWKLTL